MPSSRGSSRPRDGTRIIGRWVLYHERHLGSCSAEHFFWTDLVLLSNVGSCLWPSSGQAWVLRSLRPPGQAAYTEGPWSRVSTRGPDARAPEGDDSQHSQVLRFTAESRAPQMSSLC